MRRRPCQDNLIIRAKPLCPSRKFVTFKLLHCWGSRLRRGTCVSEKIRRVSLTRFQLRRLCRFCVTGESPVFRIYSRLFLSCSRRHSRRVNCAHALPLYCVRLYALPDTCVSIAVTAIYIYIHAITNISINSYILLTVYFNLFSFSSLLVILPYYTIFLQ